MLILQIKDTLEVKAKPGSFSLYTEFLVYSYLHPKTCVRDSLRWQSAWFDSDSQYWVRDSVA